MKYKDLRPHLVDAGGGEKYLPLHVFLDMLQKRVSVLDEEIGRPHAAIEPTQFHRGCRWEILSIIQALKERELGTEEPSFSGPNL